MAKLEVVLEQRGIASAREMSEALARCQLHGGDLTTSLLQFVSADEAALSAALSECYGLPEVGAGLLPAPDEATLQLLPREVAERYCCFPLAADAGRITLAVAHPFAPALKDELSFALGVHIEERVALEVRIRQAISRHYGLPLSARNQRGIARLDGDIDSAPIETPLGIWSDTLSALPQPPSDHLPAAPAPAPERPSRPAAERRGRSSGRPVQGSAPSSGLRTNRRRGPFSVERAREELARANTRNDVLETFFSFAQQFFEYSALFGVHSSLAEGLDAAGPGAPREVVQGVGVPLDLPSSLSEAAESCKLRLTRLGRDGIDRTLSADLARKASGRVLILPICLRGRCAVLLFGDNGDNDVIESEVADVIAIAPDVANALGRIILAKKRESLRQRASIDPAVSESLAPPPPSPSERPSNRTRARRPESKRPATPNALMTDLELSNLPARNIDKSRSNGRSGSKPNASPAPLEPSASSALAVSADTSAASAAAAPHSAPEATVPIAASAALAAELDRRAEALQAWELEARTHAEREPPPHAPAAVEPASLSSGASDTAEDDGATPIPLHRPALEDPVFLLARPRGSTSPPPPEPPNADEHGAELADAKTGAAPAPAIDAAPPGKGPFAMRPPPATLPGLAPAPVAKGNAATSESAATTRPPPPRAPFEPAPEEAPAGRLVPKPQVSITLPRSVMVLTRLPSVIVDRGPDGAISARAAAVTRPPKNVRANAENLPHVDAPAAVEAAEPAAPRQPAPASAEAQRQPAPEEPAKQKRVDTAAPAAASNERIIGRAPIALTRSDAPPLRGAKLPITAAKAAPAVIPTQPATQRRVPSPRVPSRAATQPSPARHVSGAASSSESAAASIAPAAMASAKPALTLDAPFSAGAAVEHGASRGREAAADGAGAPSAKSAPERATAETAPQAERAPVSGAASVELASEQKEKAAPPAASSPAAPAESGPAALAAAAPISKPAPLTAASAPPPVMPFGRSPSVRPPPVVAKPVDAAASEPAPRHALPPPAVALDGAEGESIPAPAPSPPEPATAAVPPPSDEKVEQLIDALCNGKLEAGQDLARLGAAPLPHLMARFPGPVISERAGPSSRASECGPLLQALASIGSPALPDITRRTEDIDARVRRWATLLLGELPGPEACRAVVQRLADDVPRVHQAALDAARLLLDSSAANLFRKTLFEVAEAEDAPLTLRLRTLEHVAKLRDSASVPRLIAFLSSDTEPIVHKALWALSVVTRQDFGRDTQAWLTWWHTHQAQHRLEWLIQALDHPEHRLRKAAAEELKLEVQNDFGYSENHAPPERQRAQARYREWWESTGARRFGRVP